MQPWSSVPVWFGGDDPSEDGERGRLFRRAKKSGLPLAPSLPATDAALVKRVRANDVAAFEALFRDLYAPLVRFARTCGVTDDVAEDVVIDVFASVWDARQTWTPVRSVAAYFFRATRNRVYNVVRDLNVAERYTSRAAREMDAPLMGEPPARADHSLEASERYIGLWECVADLSERHRVLLTLRWRDGLSLDEISAVLGLSLGATKTGLTRAMRALRDTLPRDFR